MINSPRFFYHVLTLLVFEPSDYPGLLSYKTGDLKSLSDDAIENVPYYVSIIVNQEPTCAGTIIDELFIITAAQCVDGLEPNNFLVRVGSSYVQYGGDIYRACSIKIHDLYDFLTQDNDVAIIELCRRLLFSEHIKAIPIERKRKYIKVGKEAVLSGIDDNPERGASYIKNTTIHIEGHKRCTKIYKNKFNVTDNMLCAANKGRDESCQDNFGAPLLIKNELVGILSWSSGCNQQKYPAVYTRVANFFDWIEEYTTAIKYSPNINDIK